MTNKITCMKENPELFRKFQKQAKRASNYLFATVNFCDKTIELVTFKLDKTGIDFMTKFNGYTLQSYNALKDMLDARAKTMREKWLDHFRKLATSEADGSFGIDLSKLDYAILEVGPRSTVKYYKLKWCFDDLWSAAKFISNNSNPDLEDEED